MYYSNKNIEEFDHFIEHLGLSRVDSISEAFFVYIGLETFIFGGNTNSSFANHNLNARELNDKFNRLLYEFSEFERKHPGEKQYRVLLTDLVDVKSSVDEDLFRWSYYNHKFAASQGQDSRAMDEWHELEKKIDVNRIAQFKSRRENNIAHYMHLMRNHLFFDKIVFAGIDPSIKEDTKFGLDIAEENYLVKLIKENRATEVCKLNHYGLADPILNLVNKLLLENRINLKAHIISNSKQLSPVRLQYLRNIFDYLNIKEVAIEDCNFAVLVNDNDDLNVIPIVDTDEPVIAIDLSKQSTPNFSYLLLKDEGFDQIYGYAKKRADEHEINSFVRAISSGIVYFLCRKRFTKQLALNYMDDYFIPLSNSLGKSIDDFRKPIEILTEKLDY